MTRVVVNIPDNVDLSKVNDIKLCIRYYKSTNEYSYVTEGFSIQEERPQGEWIYDTEHSITIDMYKCSVCGCYGHTHFNFCPNCGANMEGGTDIQKPNCVTCDHFGNGCNKCEKNEDE